jgi:hypothetical protein
MFYDFSESARSRRHGLTGDLIRIDNGDARVTKSSANGAFAARNAARESKQEKRHNTTSFQALRDMAR